MIGEAGRLEVKKAAHRSPNTVAFVERFTWTLQQECLDYLIVFGKAHMDHLVSEMTTYYHDERPYQAKENDVLLPATPAPAAKKGRRKKDESRRRAGEGAAHGRSSADAHISS